MSDIVVLQTTCPMCRKDNEPIQVSRLAYEKWQRGGLIQNCFPRLTNLQRETLITGYCQPCWDKMWEDQ